MANFGQLLAGAGRVSQGMESARAIRQANEARAQQLQTNRMRLEELRRMEEARARMSQIPSTIGDISFAPSGYEGMPTYEVPEQAPAPTPTTGVTSGVTPQAMTYDMPMGGDTSVDVSVADEQFYQDQQAPRTGLGGMTYEERVKYLRETDPRYVRNPITEFFTSRQRDMVQQLIDKRASGTPLTQKELGILNEYGPKFPELKPTPRTVGVKTPPAVETAPTPTVEAPVEQPPMEAEEDIPAPVAVGLDVGTKKDPIQTVAKGRPRLFEADPNRYSPYLEQGMRNREYLRQVANAYRQSGIPDKAFEIEVKIQSLDTDLYKMATDQAINEFRRGGDPARMVSLLQQFGGVPMDVQYRTDGLYIVYVNDTMLEQPLDAVSLTDELRTLVDDVYRQQKTEAQLANQKAILEAQLETEKEIMKQNAQMVREAVIAQINGYSNAYLERLKQAGFTITNLNDGRVVISAKDGSIVGLVDLTNNVEIVDGVEVPLIPKVQPFKFQ